MEASVFENGPVNVGPLSAKILERKGSVWLDKAIEISAADCHELIMIMWVHCILLIHWSDKATKKDDEKTKKDLVCSFEKKAAGEAIRMNHRDDKCWVYIPHV